MYAAAIDEIKALGDLDQPKYCAPAGAGATPASLVPFALRFLAAELPHRLGQTQGCSTGTVFGVSRRAAAP
eukprot:gene13353-15779_t